MQIQDLPRISGATPFVGHARDFQVDRFGFLLRGAREAPGGARMHFFGTDALFVSSPDAAHEVFVEKARAFEKTPALRTVLYPLAGEGLFTSEESLWRRQRKLMAPLFQPAAIAQYIGVVRDVVTRAADRWHDGSAIDLGREMTRITMGVVGKALFDADAFDDADALGDALTVALEWTNEHLGSPWLALQMAVRNAVEEGRGRVPARFEPYRSALADTLRAPVLLPGSRGPRLRGAIARLDATIQRMIDERRAAGLSRDDFLTRLLRARDEDDGGTMSDRQVRDEAVTLFVAGHETTATALTWAFYLLSRHPQVWAKLLAEANALGPSPDYRDPSRLAYAVRVFKETMRLYPPVYILGRRALEDTTIACSVGGGARDCEVPRGTIVFVSPYAVQRRADVYPDPERFDPDRFAPEAEASRPRSAYLPFGAGPRVCIGNHFALMEGPIILSALARRLSFEIPKGPLVEPGIFATLRPRTPIVATVRTHAPERIAAE
jgi:cytochrome P450